MSEKKYVKDYKKQMDEIMNNLSAVGKVIESLPESSWKKSLQTSQDNYVKKVQAFLETSTGLSDEQKKAIAAIRSGKATSEEISALSSRVEKRKPETSAGGSEQEPSKKATVKKAGKK